MKLILVVISKGSMKGKSIPITLSPYLIGRDKQCHLRPASPTISNRHCAIQVRDHKVYVRDFESTNGTFVNDAPVKGESEVYDQDILQVGPISFQMHFIRDQEVVKPVMPPRQPPAQPVDDEAMAALLLGMTEDDGPPSHPGGVDNEGVPTGSTVLDYPASPELSETKPAPPEQPPTKPSGDTSAAAGKLLKKYRRRDSRK